MKFFAIVLMTICIYITEAFWRGNDEPRPHYGQPTGCEGKRTHLNSQMKEVRCKPRPTMIKLIPEPGNTFYPNYVIVNRCSGFCPGNKSCMPVREKNVTIAVRTDYQCFQVLVEEHDKCKCQCSVMESHCNAYQIYSKTNCACECMNRRKCSEARQMVWNENMCKCTCDKDEEICSSGLEWVPSLCG